MPSSIPNEKSSIPTRGSSHQTRTPLSTPSTPQRPRDTGGDKNLTSPTVELAESVYRSVKSPSAWCKYLKASYQARKVVNFVNKNDSLDLTIIPGRSHAGYQDGDDSDGDDSDDDDEPHQRRERRALLSKPPRRAYCVNSRKVCDASPLFASILQNLASACQEDSFVVLEFPFEHSKALPIFLAAAHGRDDLVPGKPKLDAVYEAALFARMHSCTEVFTPYVDGWVRHLLRTASGTPPEGLGTAVRGRRYVPNPRVQDWGLRWLLISYVFRIEVIFGRMLRKCVADGWDLSRCEVPLPEKLKERINDERNATTTQFMRYFRKTFLDLSRLTSEIDEEELSRKPEVQIYCPNRRQSCLTFQLIVLQQYFEDIGLVTTQRARAAWRADNDWQPAALEALEDKEVAEILAPNGPGEWEDWQEEYLMVAAFNTMDASRFEPVASVDWAENFVVFPSRPPGRTRRELACVYSPPAAGAADDDADAGADLDSSTDDDDESIINQSGEAVEDAWMRRGPGAGLCNSETCGIIRLSREWLKEREKYKVPATLVDPRGPEFRETTWSGTRGKKRKAVEDDSEEVPAMKKPRA